MDLFEASTLSSGGSKYGLVVIDDYSRFTWVLFLRTKDKTRESLIKLIQKIELESSTKVKMIRSDRGTEFLNQGMTEFCETKGIIHQTSAARTPQQNGVAERKNRTLKEAARAMLAESSLTERSWAEAVNTACYVQNRVLINKHRQKTPYELYYKRKPNVEHLHIFGCKCYVSNNGKERLSTFQPKADEAVFLGYSTS